MWQEQQIACCSLITIICSKRVPYLSMNVMKLHMWQALFCISMKTYLNHQKNMIYFPLSIFIVIHVFITFPSWRRVFCVLEVFKHGHVSLCEYNVWLVEILSQKCWTITHSLNLYIHLIIDIFKRTYCYKCFYSFDIAISLLFNV